MFNFVLSRNFMQCPADPNYMIYKENAEDKITADFVTNAVQDNFNH